MRWKAIVAMVLAVAAVPGCTKQCYLTEGDYHSYHDVELPANLEGTADMPVVADPGQSHAPTSVNDTRRATRYISLHEALAIALETGHVGSQTPAFPRGHAVDTLVRFEGNDVVGSDSIRVLALLPAIESTRVEASLSRFDVSWNTAMGWARTDEQRAEFERNVNYMLLNVEIAYWNLYGSYYRLYSREEGMRVAFELWRLSKARLDVQAITQADYDSARRQYERFRGERLAAL